MTYTHSVPNPTQDGHRTRRHTKPPPAHLALNPRHPPTQRDLTELRVAAATAGRTTSTVSAAVNPGKNWIDTPWLVDPVKLLAFGFTGAERYLCQDFNTGPNSNLPQKRIEYDEAQRFIAAGADLALNWEDAAGDCFLGYAHWHGMALRAIDHIHNKLKWPTGQFIVAASFDADIGTSLTGAPAESARGWSDAIRTGGLLPGMYGSAPACNGARTQGHSVMSWITGASSWSHNIAPVDAHLYQRGYAAEYGSSADFNVPGTQPMGSYFQVTGQEAPVTPAEIDAIATAVWAKKFQHHAADGTADSMVYPTSEWLMSLGISLNGLKAALAADTTAIQGAIATVTTGGAIDYDKLAIALAAHLQITAK